jgi:hypothetical protein
MQLDRRDLLPSSLLHHEGSFLVDRVRDEWFRNLGSSGQGEEEFHGPLSDSLTTLDQAALVGLATILALSCGLQIRAALLKEHSS